MAIRVLISRSVAGVDIPVLLDGSWGMLYAWLYVAHVGHVSVERSRMWPHPPQPDRPMHPEHALMEVYYCKDM